MIECLSVNGRIKIWWTDQLLTNIFFLFFYAPSYVCGVHHFGWDFCVCDRFFLFCYVLLLLFFLSNHRGSHILSSWKVYAECVCVVGIHLSRTWMSGSLTKKSFREWRQEKGRTCDAASRRIRSQTHYWLSYSSLVCLILMTHWLQWITYHNGR